MRVIKIKWLFPLVILSMLLTATSVLVPGTFCDTQAVTASSVEQYRLGTAVEAAIDENGDVDFYTIEVTEQSNVEIYTQGSTDTFGTLRDGSGNLIAQDDDGYTEKNFILKTQLAPGVYSLEIRDYYDDRVGKYTLQSTALAASNDKIGNTRQTAAFLDPSVAFIETAIDYAGDVDFFKISVNSKSQFTASTQLDTDTYGTLYDSSGRILAENDDSNGAKNFILSATVEPGIYYLSVKDYYPGKWGSYKLIYTLTDMADDFGNDMNSAYEIMPDSTVDGFVGIDGDIDFFKFILNERKTVKIYTTGGTDTLGTLYGEDGKVLSTHDDTSSTDKNFSISQVLESGTYYISVRDYYDYYSGTYSLFMQTADGGTERTVFELESGDANTCAFAYDSGRYAYVGCNISPARIVKYDIQDMKRISALDLPAGENRDETRVAAMIAIGPDTIIHASFTNPCVFTKIDGNTMTITGTLQGEVEDVNDKYIRGLAFDGEYVYAATYTTPSKIIKFDPVTMTRVDAVTFEDSRLSSCFAITICGDYLVGVCETNDDQGSAIFRVSMDDLHQEPQIIQVPGVNQYHSICTDGTNVYAATDTDPIKVVKIDALASSMRYLATFTGEQGTEAGNFTIAYDGTSVIAGTWNFAQLPDRLIKLDTDTMARKDTIDSPSKFPSDLIYVGPYFYTSSDHPTGIVNRFKF